MGQSNVQQTRRQDNLINKTVTVARGPYRCARVGSCCSSLLHGSQQRADTVELLSAVDGQQVGGCGDSA